MTSVHHALAPSLDMRAGLAATVRVDTGIDWIEPILHLGQIVVDVLDDLDRDLDDVNARLIRGADMRRWLLAAGFPATRIRYRHFFPHLLRTLRPLEMSMAWLPLGEQYYVQSCK